MDDQNDPYLAAAQRVAGVQAAPVATALSAAAGTNPDREADFQRTAKALGLPTSFVRETPDEANAALARRQAAQQAQQLVQTAPRTAAVMAQPGKAAVASDDTGVLGSIEHWASNAGAAVSQGVNATVGHLLSSVAAAQDVATRFDITAPLQRRVFGTTIEDTVARAARRGAAAQAQYAQEEAPTDQGPIEKPIDTFIGGMPQVAGAMVATTLGGPLAGASVFAAPAAGEAYDDAKAKGLSTGRAAAYSVLQGANAGVWGELPIGKILGPLGSAAAPLYKRAAAALGTSVLTMEGQAHVDDLLKWAALNPNKTWDDFVAEEPQRAEDAAVQGALFAGVHMAGGAALRGIANRGRTAEQATVDKGVLHGFNNLAQASKLLPRSPGDFHEFATAATEDTPAQDVYVDPHKFAEVLNQTEMEPEQRAAIVNAVGPEMVQAMQGGHDARISTADWLTHVAPTKLAETLTDHVKFQPDGMTPTEAAAFHQGGGAEEVGQAVDATMKRAQAVEPQAASADQVREHVLGQLNAANRFTPAVNETNATAAAQFWATRAAEANAGKPPEQHVTPYELYAKHGMLSVRADGTGDLEQSHDGAGAGAERGGRDLVVHGAPLADAPKVGGEQFGPVHGIVAAAREHARSRGIALRRQDSYARVDEGRAKRIAAAYEAMQHAPNDPKVKAAYAAMIEQTRAQHDALVAHGYHFEFGDPNDPYFHSGWNAMRDLRDNKRMLVFPSEAGFGSDHAFDPAENPMLADTGVKWKGPDGKEHPVLANDMFRAVHDAFGHGLEGAGFRAQGEENAWQAHIRLYHGDAVGAVTSETRGQNSWLNYGPHGKENQTAKIEDTKFADQKTGLMPEWTWQEGRVGDEQGTGEQSGERGGVSELGGPRRDEGTDGSGKLVRPPVEADGTVVLDHFTLERGLRETDPKRWGRSSNFLPAEERARRNNGMGIARTYFGIGTGQPGGYGNEFKGGVHPRFRTPVEQVQARVPIEQLYDMQGDPDGLRAVGAALPRDDKGNYIYQGKPVDGVSLYERLIHDAGYKGYWTKPDMGLVAAVFEPVAVAPKQTGEGAFNQSATIRAGKETLKKYGLDPEGRYTTRQVAAALEARQRAKYGTIARDDNSPETAKKIADWMTQEVLFEMQHPERSGVGWYSEKFQRALDVFAQEFPELATDQDARDTLTALIAITSDGQKVEPNFAQAIDLYGNWRESGAFTTDRGHQRQDSIDGNVAKIQNMIDTKGAAAMREELLDEDTVSNLKKKAKALGLQFSTSYKADVKLPFSAVVFGPKLGAFYANLMGAHGYLTMDRWWSRTFNRYRGTLLQKPTQQGLARFKELVSKDKQFNEPPSMMSDDEALSHTVGYRKTYEAKGYKNGTEIEKAANTLYKAAFENLEDQPFNASDRSFMLDVVNRAHAILKRKGAGMSVADIQAVLWYYEKRLYGELGAGKTADVSYEEAAQNVLSRRGVVDPAGGSDAQGVRGNALGQDEAAPGDELFDTHQFGADGAGAETLDQRNLGSYSPGSRTVTLHDGANLSTTIHELSHYYLDMMAHLAAQPDAPQRTKDTLQDFLTHRGIDSVEAWRKLTLDEQRPHHEAFAEDFERYAATGEAPSAKLRDIFRSFRSWLMSVYRNAKEWITQKVDPTVKAVFDRMLATDDEIAAAEHANSLEAMFGEKPEGVDPHTWETYQRTTTDATDTAQETLQARAMRDLQWQRNARSREINRLKRENAGVRKATRAEVQAEVAAEPVYAAQQFMKHGILDGSPVEGAHKISIPELDALYGDSPAIGSIKAALGYGKYGMLSAEKGMHPEQMAELFGFTSADHMIREIMAAEPMGEKIDGLTEQRLLEQHGDLMDQKSVEAAADAAVANDARTRAVALELAMLDKSLGKPRILAEVARQYAQKKIDGQKVRDVRPAVYEAAMTRAGKAAMAALAKGNRREAASEKRNQLFNLYAAKAARDAQELVQQALNYFAKLQSPGALKSIDRGYLDQINALLESVDLRRSTTNKDIDRRQSLADWIKSQQEQNFDPFITPEMAASLARRSYKDLTVEEIKGLRDAIKNIEHLGRLKNKLLKNKEERDLNALVEKLTTSIEKYAYKTVDLPFGARSWIEAAKGKADHFVTSLRKFSSLTREMDGMQDGGAMWAALSRPMNEATENEALRQVETYARMKEAFSLLKGENTTRRVFEPAIGRSISLEDRLGMALNWGNELNRQRLLDGHNLTVEQVEATLAPLKAHHWDFVRKTWAHIGVHWPDVAAQLKRIDGVEPERQPALPFKITGADGTVHELDGGYYPIKYDPDKSVRAEAHSDAEIAKLQMQGAHTSATTRRGFTKDRVEKVVGRPMRLDFNVMSQHHREVIHDLAWRETLMDVNRVLRKMQPLIRQHYGTEVDRWLRQTVLDVAAGRLGTESVGDQFFTYVRNGVSTAGIALNVWTGVFHLTGFNNAAMRIGPKYMAVGIAHVAGDAAKLENTTKWVEEQSDYMRLRRVKQGLNLAEITGDLTQNMLGFSKASIPGYVEATHFAHNAYHMFIDRALVITSIPTWMGAYQKATDNGETHERAVKMADQAVRDSHSSSFMMDKSGVERSRGIMRLFTGFMMWFNTSYNQLVESTNNIKRVGPEGTFKLGMDVLLFSLSGFLVAALHGLVDGDTGEEFIHKAIADQITQYLSLIPVLREVAPTVGAWMGSTHSFDYGGPSGTAAISLTNELIKAHQENKKNQGRIANRLAGTLFHYPASQVQRTYDGVVALSNGTTHNPAAVLVGPARKKHAN